MTACYADGINISLPPGAQKRKRLFNIYSTNLSFYFPGTKGRFVCPLCKKNYKEPSIYGSNPQVDQAHILPGSVGGNDIVLTCSACNNMVGTKYDKHLDLAKGDHQLLKGERRKYVKIESENIAITGESSVEDGKLKIVNQPSNSNPQNTIKFSENAKKNWDGMKFTAKEKWHNPILRDVSLLHSALLYMFRYFGYEYILNNNLNPVRKLISDDKDRQLVANIVRENNFRSCEKGLSRINRPKEFSCFIVVFDLKSSLGSFYYVLLPGTDVEGAKAFEKIKNGNTQLKGDYHAIPIPLESIPNLDDISSKNICYKYWKGTSTP